MPPSVPENDRAAKRTTRRDLCRESRMVLALLDDEALHGAAEIALHIGQPRHRKPGTVRTDPGFRIEQNPFADRLARHADREVGIEKGPLLKIQHRRGAVAEIS